MEAGVVVRRKARLLETQRGVRVAMSRPEEGGYSWRYSTDIRSQLGSLGGINERQLARQRLQFLHLDTGKSLLR